MRTRIIVFAALLAVVYGVLAGCDKSQNQQRTVVTVSSLNSNIPMIADVLCQGDTLFVGGVPFTADDAVIEDWVPVEFFARPYNSLVSTDVDLAHGQFLVEGYRIEWSNRTGSGFVPPTTYDETNIIVPIGELGGGTIRLLSFQQKLLTWVQDLNYLGARAGEFEYLTAHITFYGREMGTDRMQTFTTQLGVELGDPVTSDCILNDEQ